MSIFDGLFRSRDKPQNRTAGSSYAFSGRAVENALLNKITAKAKPAEKAEPEPEPVKEEPAPEEPEVKPGRTIDELMARLNLIKP